MQLQEFIEQIRTDIGIPYMDVICYQEHKEIFRYKSGAATTGKEQLYMYSCSKPITVTAALRLVSEGKLSLEDKVCDYLPEVKNAYIINEKGEKELVGEQMKILHLFTMTAGFTYDVGTEPILRVVKEREGKATLRDLIPAFVETPLSFASGKNFQYSLCHDVLAAVIEVVTQKKFSTYVYEQIFAPLGMENSRFDNGEKDVPDMYMASENGEIFTTNEGKILIPDPAYESGGAGLASTVEDYIRFADALACGGCGADGYSVISAEALKELTTERVNEMSVRNNFTCVAEEYGYGLGVRVRLTETDWGLSVGEFGWDGAAGSYVLMDPNKKVSIFIGMHLRNWPAVMLGKHLQIVEQIYKEFFNK